MKVGVLATMIFGALIAFPMASFAGLAPDDDSDGIPNVLDKCRLDSRNVTLSCDRDQDGYANICDGDFNQSNSVNSTDYTMFFVGDAGSGMDSGRGTDMNCSGGVNSTDYSMFFVPQASQGTPGPSGMACAGTIPCN
jgi:hypothetical protein